MSTDRKRLSAAIQRIAEQSSDIRQAIQATKPRGDQAAAAGGGTSDAERDRICCDGSVSDSANPGTEERDTSEGGQDASDGLNPDDPAEISDMGQGRLTGLHDCATGEPVCFEGSDWVPPDGWDSLSSPPIAEGWSQGYQWSMVATGYTACTPMGVAVAWCNGTTDAVCTEITGLQASGENYQAIYDSTSSTGLISYEIYKDGPFAYTCQEPVYDDEWPSDSCVNLAIKGGSIVGSKYDPENDGSYSKPMEQIQLCDDFGNSFYLRPASNGGWKSISDLTTGPDGHLYDSTGMQIRRISHDEFTDSTV